MTTTTQWCNEHDPDDEADCIECEAVRANRRIKELEHALSDARKRIGVTALGDYGRLTPHELEIDRARLTRDRDSLAILVWHYAPTGAIPPDLAMLINRIAAQYPERTSKAPWDTTRPIVQRARELFNEILPLLDVNTDADES